MKVVVFQVPECEDVKEKAAEVADKVAEVAWDSSKKGLTVAGKAMVAGAVGLVAWIVLGD